MNDYQKVLDLGTVELLDATATDLSVVNAARVSFNKHHPEMAEGDDKLIGYLLRNKHGTPFEHNFFRFRVKAPIFVFREWHRHRVGHSYNEWSARYSQLDAEFYIPDNVRTQVGKPGAYRYEAAEADVRHDFRERLMGHCAHAYRLYEKALEEGVAREQARLFLPFNIYSQMYWSCNARSLMHWLALRNAPNAQWEIRQYAMAVELMFRERMPITWEVFNETRTAP